MHAVFRTNYSYTLSKVTKTDWSYINEETGNFAPVSSDIELRLEQALRYPGLLVDRKERTNFQDFFDFERMNGPITVPRGNLSSLFRFKVKYPVIVCGIAPGFSTLSSSEPKWLLGPSSKILHKILYKLGFCPYFTNIYKKAFEANNLDGEDKEELKLAIDKLSEEIRLLVSSYYSKEDRIFLIFLGKYAQYKVAEEAIRCTLGQNSDRIVSLKTYHPAYYLRNEIDSTDHPTVAKEIERLRREMEKRT